MKLRIRSARGGPTLKLDVSSSCTFGALLSAIADALRSKSIHFCPPIAISLNKTDALEGPDTLLLGQFGICSGDLLFYMDREDLEVVNARKSSEPGHVAPISHRDGVTDKIVAAPDQYSVSEFASQSDRDMANVRRELCAAAASRRVSAPHMPLSASADTKLTDSHVTIPSVDALEEARASSEASCKCDVTTRGMEAISGSIPSILNRVLMAEDKNICRVNDLLMLAVHAVMLETGFVPDDQGMLSSGLSGRGPLCLCYTLPSIGELSNSEGHVVLRVQTLGRNVTVYGTIKMTASQPIFRLILNTSKYMRAHILPADRKFISMFSDVFLLWKCVKDELSIPLLSVLCNIAGLPPPSSLLVLPTELKMKILEYLPALDVVRVGCTCSEFRYLCSNQEIWRRLFIQAFGASVADNQVSGIRDWKAEFQRMFESRKALERINRPHQSWYRPPSRFSPRYTPRHGIIGGDYDIYPSFGQRPFGGGYFGIGGSSGSGQSLRSLHDQIRAERDTLGLSVLFDEESLW